MSDEPRTWAQYMAQHRHTVSARLDRLNPKGVAHDAAFTMRGLHFKEFMRRNFWYGYLTAHEYKMRWGVAPAFYVRQGRRRFVDRATFTQGP